MKDVIIIGTGGHSKVIEDIIKLNNNKILGYLDDNISEQEKFNVLGTTKDIGKYDAEYIVAIGKNSIRKEIMEKFRVKWHIAIHPNAIISSEATIEEGTCIMANSVINPYASIGKGCIINTMSSIDHDCVISDYVHVSPGVNIAGDVLIGEETWIGIGSNIINNITIGENAIIGSGSTVVKDIPKNVLAFGVPCKKIKNL